MSIEKPKRRLSAHISGKDKVDMTKITKKKHGRKNKKMMKGETFENILQLTENNLHQQQ